MLEQTTMFEKWKLLARVKQETVKQYEMQLRKFDRYLVEEMDVDVGENFSIDEFYVDEETGRSYPMDRHMIQDFLDWLDDEYGEKPTVPQQCFAAVKNFFKTLFENGLIRIDPTNGVSGPAYSKCRHGVSLTHDVLQSLLNTAYRKDPFTMFYVSLVLVMAHGGLRNREVRYLRRDKVDFDQDLLWIERGQKTKPWTVSMSPMLKENLSRYLNHPEWERRSANGGTDHIFSKENGQPLKPDDLISLVAELAAEAGISKRVTPHVLRHTCATEMYRNNVHVNVIREHLRHAESSTTLIYIDTTIDEDRAILENSVMTKLVSGVFKF